MTAFRARSQVLTIAFSDLAADPRVHHQIAWLSPHYDVSAVGTAPPSLPDVAFHQVHVIPKRPLAKIASGLKLLLGFDDSFYWNHSHVQAACRLLDGATPDLVIANDIDTLPLALRLAKGKPVLFDAHEYHPREFEDLWVWNLFYGPNRRRMCRTYMPRASAVTTVCQGIADEYARHFAVRPSVVMNLPDRWAGQPRPTSPDRVRMIHHGIALPSRKLEQMIAMTVLLDDRFELDLMLIPGDTAFAGYLDELRQIAKDYPKVRFLPPVPLLEVVPFISQYDIGLYLLEPANFNQQMALPNKLFQFIQARLAVAIGPSPEMARVVSETGCGLIADDFQPQTLAAALMALGATQIDAFKRQSDLAAAQYCAEANEAAFLDLVAKLLGPSARPS